MDTYDKSGPILTPGRRYWRVALGKLNHMNGGANYPFPTERAARTFARMTQARYPGRVVAVLEPRS